LEATVGGHGSAPEATQPTEAAAPVAAAPTAPAAKWRVQFRLPPDALATGTNPLLLIDELRSLGKAIVTPLLDKIPPLAAINATEIHIGWDVTVETDKSKSALEDVFMFVMDEMELKIEQIDAPKAAPAPAPAPVATTPIPTAPATPKAAAA